MSGNLARTTTYIDRDLLLTAKMLALQENTNVYEIINKWIKAGAKVTSASKLSELPKKRVVKKFAEYMRVRPLGLKGKFSRREIYEWL